MSLQNIKKLRAERGFTIVELLIVIVVIGILAAIVIVAYTGIQDKARNTNYQTDAQALVKGAEAINADKGFYPYGAAQADISGTTGTVSGFASSSTFKVPTGVAVTLQTTAGVPAYVDALAAADASPRAYFIDPCTPNGSGAKIYYPVRPSTVTTLTVGTVTGGGC